MEPLFFLIPVLVLLGIVGLVASAKRRDRGDAIGELARETRKRDRGEPEVLTADERPSGREVERSVVLARTGATTIAEAQASGDIEAFVPPDPEDVGVSRRQFFNRSIVAFFALGLSGFGAAIIAYLWPQVTGGFGSAIRVGSIPEVKSEIEANGGFLYMAEGRMWITEYPAGALNNAREVYDDAQLVGMEAGVIALWQTCPHLGCRVPECPTSQWFECPCHGSQYNRVGERTGGPAPRGMDGFAMEVVNDVLTVDTGTIIEGRPLGVDTTGQEAEGPHCVTAGGH
ncbi:MAG: Rieske 2Fe-2S domain-containing protein [Acidimicrobiia bacterium]|nr:Rieske 2Fe-2S domain-containing protein [Acidimicrobiia bacterium]